MEKIALKVKEWISNHKLEFVLLVAILAVGAFFRLYRIDEYMTFLGDEGRDARIVRAFITQGDIMLIGPGTSIGNMFLGPMYYYFIAPGLLLANFSPVGPSVQIALFGVATIFLVWLLAREWFPHYDKASRGTATHTNWGALIAALLYAIAPTTIIFSKSSWNPNIMPFAAIMLIYSAWRVWQHREYWWLMVAGFMMAFSLQSHYLGLLLAPTAGLFLISPTFSALRSKKDRKKYIKYAAGGVAVFLLLMSPLLIFDVRHNFINFNAMKVFFTERQTTVSARPWSALPTAWPITVDFATRLLGGRNPLLGQWIALGIGGIILWLATEARGKLSRREWSAYLLIVVWLGFAVIGLGLLKQQIYDHYYGFFFPAPFLLIGGIATYLLRNYRVRGWWIVGTALTFIVYYNLLDNPLRFPPNRQLQRTITIADSIRRDAAGEQFNLAVIAERNYEAAYQYYLEIWDTGVTNIDPQNTGETIAEHLYVVCEFADKSKCDPTHDAKTEVANFGWSVIDEQWEVAGVHVFKLAHSQ